MVYQWKGAAHVSHLDPNACGAVFEALDRAGRLTPACVVFEARSEQSPLHGGFEWDDARAADAHRLNQARHLLRAIVVVRDDVETNTVPIRAFVTVTDEQAEKPQTVYTSMEAALADPVKRAQILTRARKELQTWRERYHAIEEFADVFTVIDDVVAAQQPLELTATV